MTTKNKPTSLKKKLSFFRNLGLGKEKSFLVENLTLLLSSGLNISTALIAVQEELRSKILKKIVLQINQEVENGSPCGAP